MKCTRCMVPYSLVLVFVLSTACLTLFPPSSEPAPTFEWEEPERGPLEFNPPSLPNAKVDFPYKVEIKVTKNVTPVGDFMIDPNVLPPGLELIVLEDVADTARVTGVPENAGTYTFTISVWCYGTMVSGQRGSKEYTIVIE